MAALFRDVIRRMFWLKASQPEQRRELFFHLVSSHAIVYPRFWTRSWEGANDAQTKKLVRTDVCTGLHNHVSGSAICECAE